MDHDASAWALVLAAGEGTRLKTLTTGPSGTTVPKQFCSLYEGPSLLHEALVRAEAVAAPERTCVVVAEQHRRWWKTSLDSLAPENIISQPANRGTANGILLPLLHILERDPDANIVLLPSDHHVRQEDVLAAALRSALEQLSSRRAETILLGLRPEEADPELGYIVPACDDRRVTRGVARFVEKPPRAEAVELVAGGALWNAFIVVSSAQALLDMFRRRDAKAVAGMQAAIRNDAQSQPPGRALMQHYAQLETIDFSRDVLTGEESRLRVLPVPPCGWSDLGTPGRVAEALHRVPHPIAVRRAPEAIGHLSLAAQAARLRIPATLRPGV